MDSLHTIVFVCRYSWNACSRRQPDSGLQRSVPKASETVSGEAAGLFGTLDLPDLCSHAMERTS